MLFTFTYLGIAKGFSSIFGENRGSHCPNTKKGAPFNGRAFSDWLIYRVLRGQIVSTLSVRGLIKANHLIISAYPNWEDSFRDKYQNCGDY